MSPEGYSPTNDPSGARMKASVTMLREMRLDRIPDIHHDPEVLPLTVIPEDLRLQSEVLPISRRHRAVLRLTLQCTEVVVRQTPQALDFAGNPNGSLLLVWAGHESEDRSSRLGQCARMSPERRVSRADGVARKCPD